jgi:hypothetical protein
LHNAFVPFMSARDFLLNVGPGSFALLAGDAPAAIVDD